MSMRVSYIDDDERELEKHKRRFEEDARSKDRFRISAWKTPKSKEDYEKIRRGRPHIILVDFDLSRPDENGNVIGISGVTLATELRQKYPEVPIVLFTRRSVFRIQDFSDMKRTLSSIDDIIYKNDLFRPNSTFLDSMYELAVGYRKLRRSKTRDLESLLRILRAPKSDYDSIALANPPIASADKSTWSVSDAARWICDVLIAYPGLLHDGVHSATLLGISEKEFLSERIQDDFAKAKYSELFPPPEGRWWKSRLLTLAMKIMNKAELELPVREGFPAAWERTKGNPIKKSKCIHSGKESPEWVCFILKKPVMLRYSLSYYPDSRPSIMDEARVSFKAIKTSNEVNDDLFDSIGQEMLEGIRNVASRG